MQSDTEYFRARIDQERAAAARAADKRVRQRHLELGAAYVFRLREIELQERQSAIHLVPSGRFDKLVVAISEGASVAV